MNKKAATSMRARPIIAGIAAVGALALLGSACGNDSDSSGSDGDSATTETTASSGGGTSTARGVTADSIKVVGICPVTSPTGGYPGCDLGAKARFEAQNEAGGVHGRMIEYIGTEDDTENGAKNLEQAKKAVESEEVFAIVPALGQGFLPATTDYLNEQKVPSVGWGFMPGQCAGPDTYGFGFNGCIVPPGAKIVNTSVAGPIVDEVGKDKSYALVSDNTETSSTGNKLVTAAFKEVGADVVYSKANVPTSDNVDYTPFIQDIMTSNDGKAPDVVVFNGRFQNTVGLSAGLKAAGFEGDLMNYIAYVPGLLENSPDTAKALDGSYVITQFLPVEFGGEAIEQQVEAIEAIEPDATITLGTSLAYWQADVFIQMLEAVGADLTPERFGEVVNGDWTYKPYGDPIGIGPVTYPKDHSEPSPCAAMVKIDGTDYEPITPMTCYENVPLADTPE